ncbi:MAG: ATP-binding protein [Archangium sp.]
MSDAQHVLFIGGSDADAKRLDEVLRASGWPSQLHRAKDLEGARAILEGLPGLLALIVSLDEGVPPASAWRILLTDAELESPLLALGEVAQEATVKHWLGDGADDWVFRPHLSGLSAVLTRLERERATRLAHETSEQRWREGTRELMRLARSPRFQQDDLAASLAEINEAAVRGVHASRCGVWLFDEKREWIKLIDLFDARTGKHSAGAKLNVAESADYFAALHSQRMLVVPDVRTDPRTASLISSYFGPENIGATIDVGLTLRGELRGCLCLEHTGGAYRWHTGEESFAGALADLVALALESAERARIEDALRQSERRFRELFLHSNDSIVLYRVEDGHVTGEDMNPTAARMSGLTREMIIGKTARDVLEPEEAQKLERRWKQAIDAREAILYEHEIQFPAGRKWLNTSTVPFFDDKGNVFRLASIVRDVSSVREAERLQRSLEAQVAESQKNEALARLASHIAHDVNNLLTVVNAHAQRLQEMSGKSAEVAQAILQATARGRELTQQVLTFGRRRPPERKPLELQPLVRETLKLLEPTAGGVKLRELIGSRVPRVTGDAGQLHQVLTNLCTNALQAMPGGQGTLTITLEGTDIDFEYASLHPPLQAGKWVRLTVADTGVGMDENTTRRIFEPFFSTRREGHGTGLGLSVVQSIVQGHDGAIVVDSAPERGSSFHIFLPALKEELDRPGAGQHLMLVDDHPGMARVSAKLLETLGYRTSVFDDPRDALKAFEADPEEFDAILTDLSMPQMSGEEFTLGLRAVRPSVPVIVSSGMAGELDDEARERLGISAVLVKPWRLEEAIAALRRALPY